MDHNYLIKYNDGHECLHGKFAKTKNYQEVLSRQPPVAIIFVDLWDSIIYENENFKHTQVPKCNMNLLPLFKR